MRLRFAPSPTGPLHIGGARTAIYNWAAARAMGGQFILRVEDTDRARSTDESLQLILTSLRWLGVDWDEGPDVDGDFGPYFQTQRLELYARYAARLLESGHAYKCYATPEEVAEGREALRAQGLRPMYDRRHRDLTDAQRAAFEAEGRVASLRFRMPLDERVVLPDLTKGDVEVNLVELDDWVMVRPGGMPTYNFACVVDDLEMQITHVVRGDEHFMNGIKQLVLFRVLGADAPKYAHIPLILGKNGKKLSKRDAQTNLLDYRDQGYPPAALFNYISLLGWGFSGDRDIFTKDEMVERFRIENIGTGGAHFDEVKMLSICGHYLRQLTPAELTAQARGFLVGDAVPAVPAAAFDSHPKLVHNAVACYQERVHTFAELPPAVAYVFADELTLDSAAQKNLRKHVEAPAWLAAYAEQLEQANLPPSYPADRGAADRVVCLPTGGDAGTGAPAADADADAAAAGGGFATPADLEQGARDLAERLGVKFGHLVQPIRAALSGTNKGPGLFDIVYLLGRERCLARLCAVVGKASAAEAGPDGTSTDA